MKFKNFLNEEFSLDDQIESFERSLKQFEKNGKGISKDTKSFERMISLLCKKYPKLDYSYWKKQTIGFGDEIDDQYIIDFYEQIINDLKKIKKDSINESDLDYVLLSFKYGSKKIYICIVEDSSIREVYDPIYDEMPSKSDKEDAILRAKKWVQKYGANSEHILYGLRDDKNYGKTISYETTLNSIEDVVKYIKKYGD